MSTTSLGKTAERRAKAVYISAGANRASNVSDCSLQDGLVVFGAGPLLALWNSEDITSRGIHATLPGHTGQVTVVKFVPKDGERTLISGDSAGAVLVWEENVEKNWSMYASLPGHSQSVSALASIELRGEEKGSYVVATGASDGKLLIWKVSPAGPALLQTLTLKGKLPLELEFSYLPSSDNLVLAVGATENKVHLFTSQGSNDLKFQKALSLEGHADWVRCFSFITPLPITVTPSASTSTTSSYDISPGEVLLASGSQDNYIRLWRFSRLSSKSNGLDALDELDRALAEGGEDGEIRVKAHEFSVKNMNGAEEFFSVSSEAVLLGHDAWVTGVHWAPLPSATSAKPVKLQLLSSSADRSLILWEPSPDPSTSTTHGGIWTNTRRFGEFSSATNLGFFGGLWSRGSGSDGRRTVLAHGWGGSWHVWREEKQDGDWESVVPVGGHFGTVKSVDWEPEGEYFLTAASDMTTRLHGTWTCEDSPVGWHEIARPQIHGYPITSIAFTNRLQFVSGADEKIVRVFDAPRLFVSSLRSLSNVDLGDEASRPMAANVPPLGLSNRAVSSSADEEALSDPSNDPFNVVKPVDFSVVTRPPLEEVLLGSTLWPETEKLYGHGYEIIAVAAARTLPIIATACKATTPEHAVIRLYEAETWKPVGKILEGHQLTITSMRFSRDDRWLLSVSRDRTWRLFERVDGVYQPAANSKSHARIIWDACWAENDGFFATASRDKTVKIWSQGSEDQKWTNASTLKFDEAATAVASTIIENPSRHLLAVGLENGHVHFFTSPLASPTAFEPFLVVDSSTAHVLTITSMAFSPKAGVVRLATASEDRSVRVIELA
ncbi:WD40 repeat-like protein [Meredithblackwellia eburnea MCA 4105]